MNTKNFARVFALKPAKSVAPIASELWGGATAPTIGAGAMVPLDDLQVQDKAEQLADGSHNGTTVPNPSETVLNDAQVTVEATFRSTGMGRLLQALFGWDGGPLAAGTNFGHLVGLYPYGIETRDFTGAERTLLSAGATDKVVPYFHAAEKLGDQDILAKNIAVNDWSLSVESGGALKLSCSGIAERIIRLVGGSRISGAWTAATGWTQRYRLIDASAVQFGPLGSLTSRDIFGLELNASLGRTGGDPHSGTGAYRSEPVVNAETTVTGKLTINRVDSELETLMAAMKANTRYALQVTLVRGDHSLAICIPALIITNVDKDLGGIPKTTVEFSAVLPDIASDPFAAVRTVSGGVLPVTYPFPVYLVVVDDSEDCYLLND